MTPLQKVKPGWRDDGLEEAVEIIASIPEMNAVLERESAVLAQNIVGAMLGAQSEYQAANLANDETKKALARSMLIGLQSRHHMHDREKCRTCNGSGKTDSPTISIALPPAERRALEQVAKDNQVTCYACGGSGLARDLYANPTE